MAKSKVVYVYNWNDILLITRDKKGTWRYTHTVSRVMKYLNKKNGTKYSLYEKSDILEVGIMLGYLVAFLTNECRVSYGDEPVVTKFKSTGNSVGVTHHKIR